jgi:ParB family chromosome partitioning protein
MAARQLLGGIDLDPASCEAANEIIQAERYYTKADDGLKQPWRGKVFLNPPGGRGVVKAFWSKLIEHYRAGEVTEAVWIGYSLDQLQTLQSCEASPLDFPLCVPTKRLHFTTPGREAKSPTHGNYISWLPPRRHGGSAHSMFSVVFQTIGQVR